MPIAKINIQNIFYRSHTCVSVAITYSLPKNNTVDVIADDHALGAINMWEDFLLQ